MRPKTPVPDGRSAGASTLFRPGLHAARLVLTSRIFGAIVFVQGAVALAGWSLGIDELKGGAYSLGITIKANTAISILLLGFALFLLADERRGRLATWVGRASALIAGAIGLATLLEHLFGLDLGIDQALFREIAGEAATASPNRMGPPAALSLPLIGLSLLLLDARPRRRQVAFQVFALFALVIATIPILGYIYGVRELYGIASFTGIALPTAACLALLSLGSLFARPSVGMTRLLAADDEGGMVVRRLLPASILTPIVLGVVRTLLEQHGYFDPYFGRTLMTLTLIIVFSTLIWMNAAALSKLSAARTRAESAERELTARLLEALERERASRESAEHANRMKDQFLATLSHELRTPLHAILGWARVLAEGAGTKDEMQRGLETIERNSKLQARLIDDLLDMSRIVSGNIRLEPRDVDLCAMIEAAIAAITPTAVAKGVSLHRDLPERCRIHGDPERLHQIFWNLLSNAVKFTPRGGSARVVLRIDGPSAMVAVSDDGAGIPPDSIERIFEQFHQADATSTRRHGGLGLGLSIARRLAQLHGGSITAASAGEGKGSTFTVTLPLEPSGAAPSAPAAPRPDGEARAWESDRDLSGVRVLVVDDDQDGRDLTGTILRDRGAEAVLTDGYGGALRELERGSFDVLVCDIAMPGRDGFDVIREVRKRAPDLPAIALTAFTHETEKRTREAGFHIHLTRPVDPSRLVDVVLELATARRNAPA
ncbi:MAG TPA: ATP-binding protein [Candidatus Eisenbacteria bacterium]|nr:ATP-binding protein [Candidatus Eisenbacteria bacterium]